MKKLPFERKNIKTTFEPSTYRRGRKPKNKIPLEDRLRELFSMDRLYTIDDIVRLTGHGKAYVRSQISMMQNSKYNQNPITLVQRRCDDGVKRIGNPNAEKICEVKHAGFKPKKN